MDKEVETFARILARNEELDVRWGKSRRQNELKLYFSFF